MEYLVNGKAYKTIEEAKKAEEEVALAEKKKADAIAARKAEASKVEDAFKEFNAAKRVYNEKVGTAKKVYLEEVAKANEKVNDVIKTESKILEEAEDKYEAALNEFNKAHPDGYHLTLRDGDTVKTISRSGDFDFFDSFFESFFKNF